MSELKNVKDMTTAELLAEYNERTGKSIKKFSSREAAERQVAGARIFNANSAAPKKEAPKAEPKKAAPKAEPKKAAPKAEPKKAAPKEPKATKEPKIVSSASRSEGVKASWSNKEVAAKRAERNGCHVNNHGDFRSVREAFEALNLPMEKHIKFRAELKKNGRAKFEEHIFVLLNGQTRKQK